MSSNVTEEDRQAMRDVLRRLSDLDDDISEDGIDLGNGWRVVRQDGDHYAYLRDE